MHVGRLLLIKGEYQPAIVRLNTCLNFNSKLLEAKLVARHRAHRTFFVSLTPYVCSNRMYMGLAFAELGKNDEALPYLLETLEQTLLKCNKGLVMLR